MLMSDELWALIEPLLPEPVPKLVAGRPRVPDRQALCGILFLLHTGIQWEYLPQELGFGSGMTCWRRLAAWDEAGAWDQLHAVPLEKLRSKGKLDWPQAAEPGPRRSTSFPLLQFEFVNDGFAWNDLTTPDTCPHLPAGGGRLDFRHSPVCDIGETFSQVSRAPLVQFGFTAHPGPSIPIRERYGIQAPAA
ncbi:transposase [Streptomyces cyaneochromogenes]|uniref:Transposase n=1 Tax=Streptomyces cyaneochromogenes TaxID=2496836 RepID=A0A3S9LZJ3_9ACTN|nr:transposase [Streptomyces cyaneochromogenes]